MLASVVFMLILLTGRKQLGEGMTAACLESPNMFLTKAETWDFQDYYPARSFFSIIFYKKEPCKAALKFTNSALGRKALSLFLSVSSVNLTTLKIDICFAEGKERTNTHFFNSTTAKDTEVLSHTPKQVYTESYSGLTLRRVLNPSG